MSKPTVILGTMTIGPKGQTNQADATKMLLDFCDSSGRWSDLVGDSPMVDTAIMYQGGDTEVVLGRILLKENDLASNVSISTKANPFTSDRDLSPSGVRKQLEASLKALQMDRVDIFYLHAPDARHDIEPTLEEVQNMFREQKFTKFALSNFTAWEVIWIHSYMRSRGYVVPTIYQGMYNAITRQVETELFPALRKVGMNFYAYNPLAGGMLSGKYAPQGNDDEASDANAKVGGRFAGKTFWGKRYRERYQQREQFDAVEIVKDSLVGEEDGTAGSSTLADASLRWLMHHSKLGPGDGIIMGASTLSHFTANMESLAGGPLPGGVVEAFYEADRLCRHVCPSYSRGYSGSAQEN